MFITRNKAGLFRLIKDKASKAQTERKATGRAGS